MLKRQRRPSSTRQLAAAPRIGSKPTGAHHYGAGRTRSASVAETVAEADDVFDKGGAAWGGNAAFNAGVARDRVEFDIFDVDQDRELDCEEFARLMEREREDHMHPITEAEVRQRFDEVDTNRDERVDVAEFLAFSLREQLARSGARVTNTCDLWIYKAHNHP